MLLFPIVYSVLHPCSTPSAHISPAWGLTEDISMQNVYGASPRPEGRSTPSALRSQASSSEPKKAKVEKGVNLVAFNTR